MKSFIKTRIIIVYVVLIVTTLILFDKRWNIVIGVSCGTIFGILKYIGTSRFLSNLLLQGEQIPCLGKTLVKFLSLQIVTVFFMVVSICIDLWSFFGVVAGILLVPVIILVNSITEALGISHNNFQ